MRVSKQRWAKMIAHPENYNLHKNEDGNLVGVDNRGYFTRVIFSQTERRQHMATIRQEAKGIVREVDALYGTNQKGETVITSVRNVRFSVPNLEGKMEITFSKDAQFTFRDVPTNETLPVTRLVYWDRNDTRRGEIGHVEVSQQREQEILSLADLLQEIDSDSIAKARVSGVAAYFKEQYQTLVAENISEKKDAKPATGKQLVLARQAAQDLLSIYYAFQTSAEEEDEETIISRVPILPQSAAQHLDELGIRQATTAMILYLMQDNPEIEEDLASIYQKHTPLTATLTEMIEEHLGGELDTTEDPEAYGAAKEFLKLPYLPQAFGSLFQALVILPYQEEMRKPLDRARLEFSDNRPAAFSARGIPDFDQWRIEQLNRYEWISSDVSDAYVRFLWSKRDSQAGVLSKNVKTKETRLVVCDTVLPRGFQETLWEAALREDIDVKQMTSLPSQFHISTKLNVDF